MAQWIIHPSWKKSIVERNYLRKGDNVLMAETGWRWGSFEVETEDENVPSISAGDDLYDCGYDVQMIETSDGCWEENDFDDCDDETRQWLEEFFEEGNSWYELEDSGEWQQHASEMILDCDPIFERVDGPNAGKRYDNDGNEIVENQEGQ